MAIGAISAFLKSIRIKGNTDATEIGNVADRLKTDSELTGITREDVSSAAQTTSGNSGAIDSYGYGMISALVNVTASSGTTPTLDVNLEYSEDGTNWRVVASVERFITTGTAHIRAARLGSRYYRFAWAIAGTTPSFTFVITSTLKQYLSPKLLNINQYNGLSLNLVGNVSSPVNTEGLLAITIHTIRGADGGNNGSYVIEGSNNGGNNWFALSGNIQQGVSTQLATSVTTQPYRIMRLRTSQQTNAGTRNVDIFWAGA